MTCLTLHIFPAEIEEAKPIKSTQSTRFTRTRLKYLGMSQNIETHVKWRSSCRKIMCETLTCYLLPIKRSRVKGVNVRTKGWD